MTRMFRSTAACAALAILLSAPVGAQGPRETLPPATGSSAPAVSAPADFVLGPDDVITVLFWREKDLSADAVVRPDGKISLPLVNELQAAGLTPEQLREQITAAAAKFVEDPTVTVVVKAINSRRVFITGQVAKPGPYAIPGSTTVLQLIAMSGGLLEYADSKHITIMRTAGGKAQTFSFNYKDVLHRKNLKQNIELKPGDTVVVP